MIKPNFKRNSNVCSNEITEQKSFLCCYSGQCIEVVGVKPKYIRQFWHVHLHSHYGHSYAVTQLIYDFLSSFNHMEFEIYIYFFHRGMRKHWALNNYTNMSIDIQNCPQIMCAVGCCCCFFHLTVAVRFNSLSFVFFVFFEMLVWRLNVIRIVRQKWLSVKEWMKRREIQTKLRIQSKERERAGKRT